MNHYIVPVVNGAFEIPVGSILTTAYPVDGEMWCEFERITKPGKGWRSITPEQFEAHKPAPEPAPASVPTADEDRDAMLIDLEYRLTLLELEV